MRGYDLLKNIMALTIAGTIVAGIVIYTTSPEGKAAIEEAKAQYEQLEATHRFIWAEGNMSHADIIVDRETGVCYLWHKSGYGGGLTVLVDAEGNPIIWEGEA